MENARNTEYGKPKVQKRSDYEDAPTSAVRAVFGDDVTVSECWFHYGQALMKWLKKLSLTDAYNNDDTTEVVFRCLLSLPLLPVVDILPAFQELNSLTTVDATSKAQLEQLAVTLNGSGLLMPAWTRRDCQYVTRRALIVQLRASMQRSVDE